MKIKQGNLLDAAEAGELKYIMHGCNCFHAMGGGIAGEIARRYPNVPLVDKQKTKRGDPSKLGNYTLAPVISGVHTPPTSPTFWVINLYTQFTPGADFLPSVFPVAIERINRAFKGETIGIPLIGCGIGGGDWEQVMRVLLKADNIDWEVYVL